MNDNLTTLKDEFLMILYEISKMKMVGYITNFVQGEDALMLRLVMNGSMTPKELSEHLQITKGRVTAIVNRLKVKGYVLTNINNEDKRSINVELSNLGKTEFMKKLNVADNYFTHVFNVLGLDDATSLVGEIKKLVNKIKEEKL